LLTGAISLQPQVWVCRHRVDHVYIGTLAIAPNGTKPSRTRTFTKQNVRVDYSGPFPGYTTRGVNIAIAKIKRALRSLGPGPITTKILTPP
jgi:hypothetical protein